MQLPTPARIFFDGFGSLVTDGVIRDGGTPYVTLNNRWAGYDPTGVNGMIPATTVTRNNTNFSTSVFPENVLMTSSTTTTLANNVDVQTLVVENSGMTLNLGGNTLSTNGLIFNGSNTGGLRQLTITNGNLFGSTASSVRHVVVNSGLTVVIATDANLAGGGPLAKSGTGILSLIGTTDQLAFVNSNTDITLNSGQLRAVINGANLNFGTSNVLQFRGGLLAADAIGGPVTFNRPLGDTEGSVNWATGPGDHGSGGFATFRGNLIVNLGGDGRLLEWNGQTGSNANFVRDGVHLLFNTTVGNGVIEVRNRIGLDSGSPGIRNTRVLFATGNPALTADFRPPTERTRLVGVILGSTSTNLTFASGTGVFELPTANTYAGDTYFGTGIVLTNTTGSATGTGNVMFDQANLFGSGIIAPASGKGIQVRAGNVITQSDTGPSNLTFGSPGAANNVTFAARLASQPSQLVVRLTPTASGRLTVLGTGQITLEAGTRLFIDPTTDFTPTAETTIGILDNQTPNPITGQFTVNSVVVGQDDQTSAGAWRFRVTYTGIVGNPNLLTGGNDVILYDFTPVPEPATLLALGGFAAFLLRRTKRGKAGMNATNNA